jgi:hypothetical protein
MVPASGVQTHQSDIPSAAEKDVLAVPLPGRQHAILLNPYAHCTNRSDLGELGELSVAKSPIK